MNQSPFTEESFQQYLSEGVLAGSRCMDTGELFLPPRPMCPHCYSTAMEWVVLSGFGELAAFTAVYIGPTAMVEAGYDRFNPYCTGIVQLKEGPAISAQIIGVDAKQPELIQIGTPLQVAFINRGEGDKQSTYLAFSKIG